MKIIMKKILLQTLISFTLISCGIQSKLVSPESMIINTPEINTINNSEIGITLVSKEIGFKYNSIKITKGCRTNVGLLTAEIKIGDTYINEKSTKEYDLFTNPSDSQFGIAISKLNRNIKLYTSSNTSMGVFFINIPDEIKYTQSFLPVPKKDYYKQEFIYNGRVGNALKFIYREYIDDLARPAFTQDLQYDLSESKTIGFRGLRIDVLSATNTNIEYKIITQFLK